MNINVASEIWSELKTYITTIDRGDAAETVVSILVDNDYDSTDIRLAFKGDSDIVKALGVYSESEADADGDEYEETEEEDYSYDDDE
jgi:hypothetical protein